MNIRKILIVVLCILLVGSFIDLVRMGIAFDKYKDTIIENNHFFDYITQMRIETTQLILILGFLLLYFKEPFKSKRKRK